MKILDFTALAIKIAAIVLFVLVLSSIPEYTQSFITAEKRNYSVSSLYFISPLVIIGIACVMLFLFPYKISNKFIVTPETKSNTNITNAYQIIGIRLLGLLLLFWSVSDIVFHLFNYLMLRNMADVSFSVSAYNYPYIIATGIEILFAIVLLKNATNISSYLNEISQ